MDKTTTTLKRPNDPPLDDSYSASQRSKVPRRSHKDHVHSDSDLKKFVCHVDFPRVLSLAVRVKAKLFELNGCPTPHISILNADAEASASKIRFALKYDPSDLLNRGDLSSADQLIDGVIQRFETDLQNYQKQPKNNKNPPIIVKYSKMQTDALTDWMIKHRSYPFPNNDDIKHLSNVTGLTHHQIVNWTTNVRKRNLKATVQKGKKPHHFLDFIFLADDREKKLRDGETKGDKRVTRQMSHGMVSPSTYSDVPHADYTNLMVATEPNMVTPVTLPPYENQFATINIQDLRHVFPHDETNEQRDEFDFDEDTLLMEDIITPRGESAKLLVQSLLGENCSAATSETRFSFSNFDVEQRDSLNTTRFSFSMFEQREGIEYKRDDDDEFSNSMEIDSDFLERTLDDVFMEASDKQEEDTQFEIEI